MGKGSRAMAGSHHPMPMEMMLTRLLPFFLGLVLPVLGVGGSIFVTGCDKAGPKTYPVTGTVTLDGQLLKEADIIFLPLDPALGPDAGQIRDGRFAFRAKAGPKRVQIRTSRPVRVNTAMGETTIWKNNLPARYNSQSILRAEVTPQGNNDFKYDLHTAAN